MWRCIPLRRDMAYTSIASGLVLDHATSGVFDIEISRSLIYHHRVGLGSATAKLSQLSFAIAGRCEFSLPIEDQEQPRSLGSLSAMRHCAGRARQGDT